MVSSLKLTLFIFIFANALLSHTSVRSDEEGDEDNLLNSINDYRQTLRLTALTKNSKADCLAEKIAIVLEDQPCNNEADDFQDPESKITDFKQIVKSCKIKLNAITDGAILPVCVSKIDLALDTYIHSDQYEKYVNRSKFVGAGVGSEANWVVVVLSTKTSCGSFSSASHNSILIHPKYYLYVVLSVVGLICY